MMWPYVILVILSRLVMIYLQVLSVNVIFIRVLDLIITFCYMVLEYKLINRYVKIKFFENKKRLKVLIVCQFVFIELLTLLSQYLIDNGLYLG